MANKRFIDFPIATTVGDNDIILIWQSGANKQTTKATILSGVPDSLNDLTDVTISGLTNGQILRYDSVSGQWENTDQGNLDLNDLNDVTIVSPTNGQVLVYNSSTSKWENSSGGYVPYVGAVTTVNLGAQTIQAGSFVKQGGTAGQFLKANGSVDSTAYGTGSVTSVGLTMPSAFNVANSPITTAGTLAVTGAGTVAQYIRGDGSLADFPESSGGGSSVSYYLNGSVAQGTIGGVAYKEMNKVPVLGAGTDFTIAANGYIASFLTDAGDPNLLEIPAGNWNFETYFSSSSSGGTPTFYVELYKYNGTTFTLIASNSANPEFIAFGTNITAYFTTLAVPTTTLALTDRLAVRYYVTHSGRTITMHTEGPHLCQIITTFTTGLTALNGLTAQVQNFAVGTTGTDFNIASAVSTHTFNLPTASATNRGALSSADWSIFNAKANSNGSNATGTWGINITGNSTAVVNTVTGSNGAELVRGNMADNDYFRILVGGSSSNNGFVEIATADDGTEPIIVRQYTGVFTSIVRSASLLDSSGNTSFPGSLTASSIIRNGGTSSQYLMADGSVSTLTNPVTGTGVNGRVAYWNGTNSITSDADLLFNGSELNVSGIKIDGASVPYIVSTLAGNDLNIQFPVGQGLNLGNNAGEGVARIIKNNITLYNGASTIQTSTGNLTIATGGSNGNIILSPNGSGTTTINSNVTASSFIRSGGISSQYLMADGSVSTLSNPVTGTGTTNYLPKFTGTSTIGNSNVQESSGYIGIGITPSARLHVNANDGLNEGIAAAIIRQGGSSGNNGIVVDVTNTPGIYVADFRISNSSVARITNTGNLLVGTTTDNGARLQVSGTATFSNIITANSDIHQVSTGGLYWGAASTYVIGVTGNTANGNLSFITGSTVKLTIASTGAATFSSSVTAGSSFITPNGFGLLTRNAANTANRNVIFLDSSNQISIGNEADINRIRFGTASSPNGFRMYSAGNIGIGPTTTDFGETFMLATFKAGSSNYLRVQTDNNASYDAGGLFTDGTNNVYYGMLRGTTGLTGAFSVTTGGTTRFNITSGGNVGIGTPSPVNIGGYTALTLNNATTGGILTFQQNGVNKGSIYNDGSSNMYFGNNSGNTVFETGGSPRITIALGGNILIGTTTDFGQKLQVSAGNTSESTAHINLVNSGIYSGFHFLDGTAYYIGQNSAFRSLRMYSGASTLVGVNLAAAATSWGTYSDERLKENIDLMESVLPKIVNLRAVKYHLKNVDTQDSKKRIGLIAQDLVGNFDEVLSKTRQSEKDKTEYYEVRYTEMIPVLLKAIQELKQEIDTLKN